MNLEPIIQCEVSQKENYQYLIVTHIYREYRKMVLMNLFAGQQWRNRHREQTYGHRAEGRKERVRYMQRVTWKLTIPYIK